jgi:uncharacterized membrane protein YfcA
MSFVVIGAAAVLAGFLQAVTGFGSPMILMMVVPYFYNMVASPAVANSISIWLAITLAWKFRKHIDWKSGLFPTAVFFLFNVLSAQYAKEIDLNFLSLAFGVFLVILAAYFFLFSKKKPFRANGLTTLLCGTLSGITSGLFGIGGPLMAIYFVSATKTKESYIGNLQFLFTTSTLASMTIRIINGIYTVDMLPVTIVGVACIMVGKSMGLKLLNKLDPEKTQKIVYGFVGITGLINVIQYS